MKIKLTKYGWPQVVIWPLTILAVMIIAALSGIYFLPLWAAVFFELFAFLILVLSLAFFRDPYRECPTDVNILLSPADGRITDIEIMNGNPTLNGDVLKIGIFLSIFNVHLNRAPCNARVEKIVYKKGKYKNAMSPESSFMNESNELQLVRIDNPTDKLIVKQISGAIARRIVCRTNQGQTLSIGQKFGMIKYGSRTELYVPVDSTKYEVQCLVKKGDKVKAGLTALVRYEKCPE